MVRQFTTRPSVWAKNERAATRGGRGAASVRTPGRRARHPRGHAQEAGAFMLVKKNLKI